MVGVDSLSYLADQLGEWGPRAVPKLVSEFVYRFPVRKGESIWAREWDLLIVLDACRVDWMEQVADEYAFIDGVDRIWSVGGHSEEWLRKTFTEAPDERLHETGYVSANPFTDNVATEPFAYFENVAELAYEGGFPTPPAHVVTDRAIGASRTESPARLVVHYMQPHRPFFSRTGDRREVSMTEWSTGSGPYHQHFDGTLSREALHHHYVENLRYALDEVELLLENVDAPRTVITADHGHALGERFLWDHRQRVQHPVMREVPWIETQATDAETHAPPEYQMDERSDESIEERLRALGYR